ncbi:hypothetical protein LG329_01475 [Virgibacillus necropolis]|uniref:hypothetical protein n=1 Tax=Virgibacillus necropolis TaxID=163877 RepID=UPI00384BAB63
MGVVRKEINIVGDGLNQKGTIDSLQHIYDQLQMIDHVLDLQVDHAILDTFQRHNKQINEAMKEKSRMVCSLHDR